MNIYEQIIKDKAASYPNSLRVDYRHGHIKYSFLSNNLINHIIEAKLISSSSKLLCSLSKGN